ncbi:MAG TPA: Phenylacetic acid catabolic protein [Longimicrobiales bacterium]|nr:Phenylacetic acid catabolic protein [Longimicrobiales bacterium]
MTTRTRAGAGVREEIRDLILVLADSKRLLGYRYAEWMLGAPELESGIALSSMAQDEWGHARLLYALLKDSEDVELLEHGREAGEYRNIEVLDAPTDSWGDAVVLMALVDMALSVQFEALRTSSHEPLRQRVEKVLEEERFHAAHGAAWFRRMARGTEASAAALRSAVERVMDPVLRWFGRDEGRAGKLVAEGVVDSPPSSQRRRFLAAVAPLLEEIGLGEAYGGEAPELEGFDESRRRSGGGGPDEATIRRIRGDRNRAFLMD